MSGELQSRVQTLEKVRELGMNPFPHAYRRTHVLAEVHDQTNYASVAGRIMGIRDHGRTTFMTIQDTSGQLQLYFMKDINDPSRYDTMREIFHRGDFIGASGRVFRTRRGELTVEVQDYTFLSKSLRPLPEKHAGLRDTEIRYRHRTLDLIANPESREVFIKRSQAISLMRQFLDAHGYLEIETPLIQPIYGGANARPFITKIHALDDQVAYLQISPELYLKRLLIGGLDRVYALTKNFRNEGIDTTHNPEFTMMECYAAYADYHDMMDLTERMYEFIFKKINGTTAVVHRDASGVEHSIDVKTPWRRIRIYEALEQIVGVNPTGLSPDKLREVVQQRRLLPGIDSGRMAKWELVMELVRLHVEPTLIQPTFLLDHPQETTPLCKVHRENPDLIERFEPYIVGMEIGNAYTELNDPIHQKRLLEQQAQLREKGDEEAHPMDKDFIYAMEHGMPPTGGLGLGIDRLVMLLTRQYSIKDVIAFPMMRVEENGHNG
ncbi:lysine--tRNA ligase [Candidatus Woesearchaeota archaeon]|nr:lysine--tRNA ligase [Candidatus Woesearchaeota archaeon]